MEDRVGRDLVAGHDRVVGYLDRLSDIGSEDLDRARTYEGAAVAQEPEVVARVDGHVRPGLDLDLVDRADDRPEPCEVAVTDLGRYHEIVQCTKLGRSDPASHHGGRCVGDLVLGLGDPTRRQQPAILVGQKLDHAARDRDSARGPEQHRAHLVTDLGGGVRDIVAARDTHGARVQGLHLGDREGRGAVVRLDRDRVGQRPRVQRRRTHLVVGGQCVVCPTITARSPLVNHRETERVVSVGRDIELHSLCLFPKT